MIRGKAAKEQITSDVWRSWTTLDAPMAESTGRAYLHRTEDLRSAQYFPEEELCLRRPTTICTTDP